MDEKNTNTNGFDPKDNQEQEPIGGEQPHNESSKQETPPQNGGWVFSDKNVNADSSQQSNSFNQGGSQKTPDENGWYHYAGGNNNDQGQQSAQQSAQQNGYQSKYSYTQNDASYQNQQPNDPKASETYKWNYEDYNQQQEPKKPAAKNKKCKNKGLKVFSIIMCIILGVGVVSLAGYGTYALIKNQNKEEAQEAESAESEASAELTLTDKPKDSAPADSGEVKLAEGELTITQRAHKVQPSAVGIVAYLQSSKSIFGGEQSQGSGIIATKDGYIITNAHVVAGATSVKVVLNDNKEYNAAIIGVDEKTDLAVLKIEANDLTPAEFGNSDQLEIGEQVITVGNPGGLELAGSVTVGYVSALNRPITTATGNTINCIQTDAAINPGNSGGALVNTYGQVVGINSQKIAATEFEGIGFAISINEAQPIINDLIRYGYVKGRVKMGITMQMIDRTTAQIYGYEPGAGVVSVEPNSPAEKAGLVPGDIITEIDGESVADSKSLSSVLQKYKPGDVIKLTVFRQSRQSYAKDQRLTMKMELSEAGAPAAAQNAPQIPAAPVQP